MAVETIQTFPSTSYGGNIFKGWFADSNFNNEVQFPYPDNEDTTLYAKWELASVGMVTFTVDDGNIDESQRYQCKQ